MKKYKILSLLINITLLVNLLMTSNNKIILNIFLYLILFYNIFNKQSKYIYRLFIENKKFLILVGYIIYFISMLYLINLS